MVLTGSHLHISLFGEFNLVFQGKSAPSFSGDRPISLLAYLLLHRQTAVSRQHLAFILWPDSSDSQARANLRNLFYTLRQTLPAADNYLAADSMTLQWRCESDFSLDVAEFEAALAAAKTAVTDADKMAQLETAVSLYQGDLLPGNYDDWIIPLREELRQAYLDALHQLMQLQEQSGDFRAAARIGQRLIQHDPLDEPTYVQLMRLHALSGDRAGVRRVYEQCGTALRRELDVEPGPATVAAYEQFLRLEAQAVPASATTAQAAAPPIRPSALPMPATPFIGREAELAHLAELLADPACRLLTIVGQGGIGKTRLALETAVGHQPVFADGVIWVSLNDLQTPDQLSAAIAEALQYRLRGADNAETELLHVLTSKKLLLILDNFEHLLGAADFLTRLVAQTTAVKLLVTSRLALGLQEEWRFDLGELPIPDTRAVDTLADNSAVQLFVQSARRAASHLILSAADFPAIAQICQLVGGMPLGIELAASWTRLLSCAEIAQEIEKSLDFLTVNLRNVPPRHRSLRAVFDYSWDLLSPDEQRFLARLSVFQGGFTREAAAQIAAVTLPQLSLLVDRSLVQRTAVGRYNLHNIIRQYANDHLQTDPTAVQETAQRHSDYYLRWLADQDEAVRGPQQKEVLTAVAADLANIRAAGEWGIAHQSFDLLCQAAFPLFYFYELRGLLHSGEALFRQAAERLAQGPEATTRAAQIAIGSMRTNQAYFALRLGQVTAVETWLREVVDTLQTLADETVLSYSLRYLSLIVASNGRLPEAIQLMRQSLDIATRREQAWEMAITQAYIGMLYHDQGRLPEAQHFLSEALANSRRLQDVRVTSFTLLLLSRTQIELGQLDLAEEQLTEVIALAEQTNDIYSINMANWTLGIIKRTQGELADARRFLQISRDSFALVNDLVGVDRISISMGFLELELGHEAEAKACFLATLQAEREQAIKYILGAVIGLTSLFLLQEGEPTVALVWVLSVLGHPTLDWEVRQRAETMLAELSSRLTPEQFAAARQQAANQPFLAVLADVISR